MAEKSEGNQGNRFEDIVLWGILALIVYNLLLGLPNALERRLGLDGGLIDYTKRLSVPPGELSHGSGENIPSGTRIKTSSIKEVWNDLGNTGSVFYEVPRNTEAVILDGPVLIDGLNWWKAYFFEDDVEGWISGDDISIDYEHNAIALLETTEPGTKVITNEETNLLVFPSTLATVRGTVSENTKGTLVGGPRAQGENRFWEVLFENGSYGWIHEFSLRIDFKENNFSLTNSTPPGTPVLVVKNTKVWSSPGDGVLLGEIAPEAKGSVLQGPVTIDAQRWWKISFENGGEGWVLESTIIRNNIIVRTAGTFIITYKKVALVVSLFFIIGILYSVVRVIQVRKEETEALQERIYTTRSEVEDVVNKRWKEILDHASSPNESDWRLAIIEADSMLDEMMEVMGYQGETLGEKLKSVEKSDFTSIEKAWEAHKVRNMIAHKGSTQTLSQREARRIIALYEEVFTEFQYI